MSTFTNTSAEHSNESINQSVNQSSNELINESISQSINESGEDESWREDIDEREVWLKIWNNSTDPAKISCVTAFDILYYCYSPANQLRAVYRTGKPAMCEQQKNDLVLCTNIKVRKIEGKEAVDAIRESRDHFVVREPHVWEFRDEPTSQWRRATSRLEKSESEAQPKKRWYSELVSSVKQITQSSSQLEQSTDESIDQSIVQSIDQSIDQPVNQSVNESVSQSINQSVTQPTNQSVSQPANESSNQSFNQSMSQSDECRTQDQAGCQSIASKVQNYMLKVWKYNTGTS